MMQPKIEERIVKYNYAVVALLAFGFAAILLGALMWLVLSPEPLTIEEMADASIKGVPKTSVDKMIEMSVAVKMTRETGVIFTIAGVVGLVLAFGINFIAEDLRKQLRSMKLART